jgi:hypothetical protein
MMGLDLFSRLYQLPSDESVGLLPALSLSIAKPNLKLFLPGESESYGGCSLS